MRSRGVEPVIASCALACPSASCASVGPLRHPAFECTRTSMCSGRRDRGGSFSRRGWRFVAIDSDASSGLLVVRGSLARFRPPSASELPFFASPKKGNPKKGDPDEAPSLREGTRRGYGVSRRYIRQLLPALLYLGHPCPRHVPTRNSRASCARPFGLILRPAAASYGARDQEQRQDQQQHQRQEQTSRRRRRLVGSAEKPGASSTIARYRTREKPVRQGAPYSKRCASNVLIRHPGERRDPALASDLDLDLDLDPPPRRWRRAAQPDVGERRLCLRPWMAELGAGRRPASSAGNRSGFIGSAPASGRLSLGYLSLATQRKVTRTPKADETGRSTRKKPRTPSSHRDRSPRIAIADTSMKPRGRAFLRSCKERLARAKAPQGARIP
jgi:hypothetical protein